MGKETMDIETTCNTSNEVLFNNVRVNSRKNIPWLKSLPEHDGHAVLVGGGPSLKDWVDEIRMRKDAGQTIFALNGAALYLKAQGIKADHCVVVDARESNIKFIGHAEHHYLSSQCHPSLFDCNATLWHQEYPEDMAEFESALPEEQPEHTLIGGGTTVGLSAMALVYALGYRKLHLYGYDSSYQDGDRHAYSQHDPQNVDCVFTVAGKSFNTSLAMARQAELFPEMKDTLLDLGCLITIRGDGLLPWISEASSMKLEERQKYESMWEFDKYRAYAPGEDVAPIFMLACPDLGTVIDFGAGTGRGALKLYESGYQVSMLDFAENCLDSQVREKLSENFTFRQADLTKEIPISAEYGFCTDVLEHIPTEDVDTVLGNICNSVTKAFFQISTVPDHCGKLIGHPLHLTVQPFSWWYDKISQYSEIRWSQDQGDTVLFYVTTHRSKNASL